MSAPRAVVSIAVLLLAIAGGSLVTAGRALAADPAERAPRKREAALLSSQTRAAVERVHALRGELVRPDARVSGLEAELARTRELLSKTIAAAQAGDGAPEAAALASEAGRIRAARPALRGASGDHPSADALQAKCDELAARIERIAAARDAATRRAEAQALLDDLGASSRARHAQTGPTFRFAYPTEMGK